MTLKERIEDQPVIWLLGALFTGFLVGIGTYQGIMEIASLETSPAGTRASLNATQEKLGAAIKKLEAGSLLPQAVSYVPTDDIETELRHHVEITGVRDALQAMKARLERKYREHYKLADDEVACVLDTSFFGNDYIEIIIEAHKKHMTLQEVQELNRFFSSGVMAKYKEKQTAIVQDFMQGMDQLAERKFKTFKRLAASSKTDGKENLKACPAE